MSLDRDLRIVRILTFFPIHPSIHLSIHLFIHSSIYSSHSLIINSTPLPLLPMLPNASKRFRILPNASERFQMPQNAFNCFQMLSNAIKCFQMFSNAFKCFQMHSNACKCIQMLSNASKCVQMLQIVSNCFRIFQVASECFQMLPDASRCFRLLQNASPVSTKQRFRGLRSVGLGFFYLKHRFLCTYCEGSARGSGTPNICRREFIGAIARAPPEEVALQVVAEECT